MTKRIHLTDDESEWIEINKRVADAVVEDAMQNDRTFGDALADYLNARIGSNGEDN